MRVPLQTERLTDGKRKLLRELTVDAGGLTFVIPESYVTDYSSIPWWARWVVRWSRVDVAGVVHDHLYANQELSRRAADRIWRLIARDGYTRANWVQAWVCWLGLRVGGWIVWYRRKPKP